MDLSDHLHRTVLSAIVFLAGCSDPLPDGFDPNRVVPLTSEQVAQLLVALYHPVNSAWEEDRRRALSDTDGEDLATYGYNVWKGGPDIPPPLCIVLLRASALKGNTTGMIGLAQAYAAGVHVDQDATTSRMWFERAKAHGYVPKRGALVERALGVEPLSPVLWIGVVALAAIVLVSIAIWRVRSLRRRPLTSHCS